MNKQQQQNTVFERTAAEDTGCVYGGRGGA